MDEAEKFNDILARISSGERVATSEILPYLCLESKEQRCEANARLAEVYAQLQTTEHLQQARVFIQRAWILAGGSVDLLPLYTRIASVLHDAASMRDAYKRLGMKAAAQNDISKAIDYFTASHYAYATFSNLDKYEYDFDILSCVDALAAPYRFDAANQSIFRGTGKIRMAHLVKGATELDSILVEIDLMLAKYYDKSRFEVTFFIPETEEQVETSSRGEDHIRRFQSFGWRVVTAPKMGNQKGTLLALATLIHESQPHLMVTSAALSDYRHYFITSLRPAPISIGLVQGPPPQFAPPILDWAIAWSKHPQMDAPVDCTPINIRLFDYPKPSLGEPYSRETLAFPKQATVLMSAGRHHKFQSVEFWKAMADLLTRHPEVFYVVSGTSEQEIPFLHSVVPDDVKPRLRFLGWRNDFLQILPCADILIDTYPNGGGQVVVAAMSLGIPFVSQRNDYLKRFDQMDWRPAESFIQDEEIIVPRGNFERWKSTISKLIEDKEYRATVGERCRAEHLREANPANDVRRCEEIYLKVLTAARERKPVSSLKKPEAPLTKLAVLSHILPPSPSGQATMLHRLLRTVPVENYCLISRDDYSHGDFAGDKGRLPAPYYHVSPETKFGRPNRFGLYRVRDLGNILAEVYHRAKGVAHVVKLEKCGAIMACSGDVIDIPAGYLASRWAKVPFYAYLFDDYLYQWTRPLYRWFVKYAEPIVLKRAAGVIVPNEFLRDEYRRRYGVEPTVIHNPFEIEEIAESTVPLAVERGREVKIIYTGAISQAHFDAFRNLVAAIEQLSGLNVRLHLYTAHPREELDRENIRGPIIYHYHVPPLEAHRIQRQADILFLPLSFNSNIPEVIKTSAPAKMGEYLACGRPILAHAPGDSFVSSYFKEHDCGVVVDQSDPATLARAIERILGDESLRRRIAGNALVRAKVDFSLVVAQTKFLKLLSSEREGV